MATDLVCLCDPFKQIRHLSTSELLTQQAPVSALLLNVVCSQSVYFCQPGKHSKHTVFTVVMAHAATAFRRHFHPWDTKDIDLETISDSGTRNRGKITKNWPKWISRHSLNAIKIDEKPNLDLQVPLG